MNAKWIILFIEVMLGIIALISARSDGHGMFNGDVAWAYPECGRKATKCYGGVQLIMLILTSIEFLLLNPNLLIVIVSGLVGILIPLFGALFVLHRLGKKEMIKDEMYRREQIRKEETTFHL